MEASAVLSNVSSQELDALRAMAQRLRRHSLVITNNAGSGHPTSAMSCAELVAGLFFQYLHFDLENPRNPYNDRFVLSKGHATPVLWSALAEAGAFPQEELKTYRQFGSALEGHPTPRSPWVDAATGALGQGLSIGAGMAYKSRLDNIDNQIFVLMGDGETAEGNVWEAVAFAAHYRLGNLIGIVDVNRLGQTEATMYGHDMESYRQRFEAFGWRAEVIDGHDMGQVLAAYQNAVDCMDGPYVILAKTLKGKGVSFLEDENGRHGKPVTGEEFDQAIAEVGDPEPDVALRIQAPAKSAQQQATAMGTVEPPAYEKDAQVPTRKAYAYALTKVGRANSDVIALDAELKNSTYTEEFLAEIPERFIECYIAEQNMIGAAHGLSALGKIPFCSSFASFLSRAYDQIRMASISNANIKYAGSHAGISIGEDGPSQMGLEDLAMFRALHGCTVFYPCDAVSCERMVELAARHEGAFYIRLTRPATPILYDNADEFAIGGSKVLRVSPDDKATIVTAGFTVHEALKAREKLESDGIPVRVIDAYSVKPIDADTIREAADATGAVVTVEDHYPEGGLGDAVLDALAGRKCVIRKLAVNDMPRSGDPAALLEHYGIGASRIVEAVKAALRH